MLQKMRSLSPFIIATVIITFIVLMVVGDMDIANTLNMTSRLSPTSVIGEINGDEILYNEFEQRVKDLREQQVASNKQQGREDQEVDENQIQQQAWDSFVNEILARQEAKKAGLTVSKEEIADVMMENPPDFLKNQFKDSTGAFMRDLYMQVITDVDGYVERQNIPADQKEKNKQDITNFLTRVEKAVLETKLSEKMQVVAGNASAISPEFLKRKFASQNTSGSVSYVLIDAMKVSDKEAKVSDDEIAKYYESHKQFFKQKPGRKIKYVQFPLVPSREDSARSNNKINTINTELSKYADLAQRDSVFTHFLGEYSGVTKDYALTKDIDPSRLGFISSLPDRAVIGPVNVGGSISFLRVDGRQTGGDTSVRASHILINFGSPANKDSAKAEAEKALARVRGGEDFAKVAMELSQDPGSKNSGGDLNYFTRGRMVPEFEKAAFGAAVGSVVGPVESQFGYHIIKVTDKKSEKLKYSEIAISTTISSSTRKDIQRNALAMKEQLESGVNFDTLAKRLKKNATESVYFEKSNPILGSYDLTSFAFANPVGKVAKPTELRGYGIVVVQVTGAREEGISALEDVKDKITQKLQRIKKLDIVKSKAEAIAKQLAAAGSLDGVKSIDSTLEVRSAAMLKDDGNLQNMGQDVPFAAAALKLPQGKVSGAIRGERGYYIAQLTSLVQPDNSKFAAESEKMKSDLMNQAKQSAYYMWMQTVREKSKIEDNRPKLFNNGL
ncbi:MAG: peptidylprolyl isomerase [Candidatus Kapabacteria bacterium]|nr:peptidylprolyl isomerase [Candidatus Kapabacteria bacterium]